MEEEAEIRRRESPPVCEGGGVLGSPKDFPYLRSLSQSSLKGDFSPPLDYALEEYHRDSNPQDPNLAPRDLWPSTSAYRSILYEAGKRLGQDATANLESVPDKDLRLFAQIELAAALTGLPQFRGITREHRGPANRTRRPLP